METDVVVVGAGMAGNLAAKAASEHGARVTVLEEHSQAGKFRKCTGIVSKAGLDSLGIHYQPSVLNEIFGADLIAQDGRTVKVRSSRVQACVLERQDFDHLIAREAQDAGATYVFDNRATNLVMGTKNVRVDTNKNNQFESKLLIGADGAGSQIAKMAGLADFPASRLALCWEGEYQHASNLNPHVVLVWMDALSYKGLFGWAVPVSETVVRIGFGTTRKDRFAQSKKEFLALKQVRDVLQTPTLASQNGRARLREFTYVIPLGPRPHLQKDRVWLVGDAAGQVKATTGGGIVFGGNAALLAGQLAGDYVSNVNSKPPAVNAVPNYESTWRKKFGSMLDLHLAARFGMDVAGNRALNAALGVGSAVGLGHWLSSKGDMDFFASHWRTSTRSASVVP